MKSYFLSLFPFIPFDHRHISSILVFVSDATRQKDAAGMDATLNITIPNDLAGCRALIEQLISAVASQASAMDVLRREKQELEAAYAELVQRAFRHRSERYLDDPNQLRLDLGGTPDATDAADGLAQAIQEAGLPVKAHVRSRGARPCRNTCRDMKSKLGCRSRPSIARGMVSGR